MKQTKPARPEAGAPNTRFRFRGMDCPRHGKNVLGCVSIESTKRGGKAEIPRCYLCVQAEEAAK